MGPPVYQAPAVRARTLKLGSVEGNVDQLDTNTSKSAHPRPAVDRPKGATSQQDYSETLRPNGIISTKAPNSANKESVWYLFEHAKESITEGYQKPIWDEYHECLKNLLVRFCSRVAADAARNEASGIWDREDLAKAARLKLKNRLEAVQSTILKKIASEEDNIISDMLCSLKEIPDEKPLGFTREELAQGAEIWADKRRSLGLPLDDEDSDDYILVRSPSEQTEGIHYDQVRTAPVTA